jgi:hypothetical protein
MWNRPAAVSYVGQCRQGALALLLLAALAWQVAAALRPAAWITQTLTADDTYLALQVALNWTPHGFPTFDGLHRTNGFQALWGILLRGLAGLTSDHVVLLRLALVLVALLNTISGFLLMRLARRLGGALAAVWTVALWSMYCVAGRPAMIGLENALVGTVTAGVLLQMHGLLDSPRATPRWLAVAALLGLLVWARLDCLVPAAIVGLGLVWLAHCHAAWRGLVLAGVVSLALLAGLAAFNSWAGGTLTPVSGQVKRLVAAGLEPHWTPLVLLRALLESALVLIKTLAGSIGVLWPRALSSLVRVAILALFALLLWRRILTIRGWAWVWLAALGAHVLAIRLWLSAYYLDTLWYYGPQYVSMCLWIGCACAAGVQQLARRAPDTAPEPQASAGADPPPGPNAAAQRRSSLGTSGLRDPLWPLLLAFGRIGVAAAALFVMPTSETATSNRLAAAEWLRKYVPVDERIAAWNAGELAYFSRRTLINLDGLVNDRSYLARLREGLPTGPYLDEQRVTWVVDCARNLGWLPRERWQEMVRFGTDPQLQQLVLRRRAGPGESE